MNVEQITELLTKSGIEVNENVNVETIKAGVNDFATGLKTNGIEDFKKSIDPTEYVNSFLTENGFENVDQFSAFTKNAKASTTELQEKTSRYEAENSELQNKLNELNGELFTNKASLAFATSGVKDAQVIKDFMPIVKANMEDGSDLNTIVSEVVERYKLAVETPTPKIGGAKGAKDPSGEMSIAEKIAFNLKNK